MRESTEVIAEDAAVAAEPYLATRMEELLGIAAHELKVHEELRHQIQAPMNEPQPFEHHRDRSRADADPLPVSVELCGEPT